MLGAGTKRIIAIGGGELKERTTLAIDEYIATLAKAAAGERRANALFIPTASHDFMPYYNTFHKVYTGMFDIKTDVLLSVFKDADLEKWQGKIDKADVIYVGGGDTVFMIEHWKKVGLLPLLRKAYDSGKLIVGLSAGAICWFSDIYTDSLKTEDGAQYAMFKGLGWIDGIISPHYGSRMLDFDKIVCYNYDCAFGIEDNAALLIKDGEVVGSISAGGAAYRLMADGKGGLTKEKI
ncbi:MAG: peptidase E [Clostridia bacterium]|nr:peptidase E [Clostridia bacterium]